MTVTITNALLVPVPDDGPDRFTGRLRVDDAGRISGIGPGSPPEPGGEDAGDVVDAGT